MGGERARYDPFLPIDDKLGPLPLPNGTQLGHATHRVSACEVPQPPLGPRPRFPTGASGYSQKANCGHWLFNYLVGNQQKVAANCQTK